MATTKKLALIMTADAKQVESTMQRVQQGFSKLQSSTAGLRSGMAATVGGADPFDMLKGTAKNLVGEIPYVGGAMQSAANAAEAFYDKIRSTQKAMLDQGKAALASGSDVEKYSQLLYATGGDSELLQKSLFKLNVFIADAAANGGEAAEMLEKMGLNARRLSGDDSVEQLLKVTGALTKQGKGFGEAGLEAHKIWGKMAHEIMPELAKGEEALRAKMGLGKERGLTTTFEDVAAVKQADIAIKQLDRSTEALWKQISVGLSPAMKTAADNMRELMSSAGDKGGGGKFRNVAMFGMLWTNLQSSLFSGGSVADAVEKTRNQLDSFDASVKNDAEKMSHWAKAIQVAANETKRLKDEQEAANHEVQAATEYFKEANRILATGETPWEKFTREAEMYKIELDKVNASEEERAAILGKLASQTLNFADLQRSMSTAPGIAEAGSRAAFETRFEAQNKSQSDIGDLVKLAQEQGNQQRTAFIDIGRAIDKIDKRLGGLGLAE